MSNPVFRWDDDGKLVVRGVDPWLADILLEVPDLLGPDQPPEVERRLFPKPSDDERILEDWSRLVAPELFALLASAREIVADDLALLSRTTTGPGTGRLEIPRIHVNAWISALNAARLAISTRHGIEETDMREERQPSEWSVREEAIAKTHLLGWIQGLLIHEVAPAPDDDEDDAGERDEAGSA